MDKIICVGESKFSYNTSKAIHFLDERKIDYEYVNINEIDDNFNTTEGSKLLFVENNTFMFYRDFDFLPNKYSSHTGKKYRILKSKKFKFYNNFDNHFRCYSKWSLYQILLKSNITTLKTKFFNCNVKLESILNDARNMQYPVFIRAADAQLTQNYSLLALNDKDVSDFYNDCAILYCDDYVIQEYAAHSYIVSCNYFFNNMYYTVKIKDKNDIRKLDSVAILPYEDKSSLFSPIVKNISSKLGLNCFSVSFALKNKVPVVLGVRVPGNFIELDAVYNTNSINVMMEKYIYEH